MSFPQLGASFGSSISQTNNTTFSVSEAGYFRIDFILPTTLLSVLGGAQIEINGVAVPGSSVTLASAGTQLVGMALVELAPGDTLQIGTTGLSLALGSGSSVMITQLSAITP